MAAAPSKLGANRVKWPQRQRAVAQFLRAAENLASDQAVTAVIHIHSLAISVVSKAI
ncbi:MAG TPA: hypothetical protein VJN18_29135 [Polyangiaceae bacterium]|nr:hypothetical protein [Polyangiaceae bacterium]